MLIQTTFYFLSSFTLPVLRSTYVVIVSNLILIFSTSIFFYLLNVINFSFQALFIFIQFFNYFLHFLCSFTCVLIIGVFLLLSWTNWHFSSYLHLFLLVIAFLLSPLTFLFPTAPYVVPEQLSSDILVLHIVNFIQPSCSLPFLLDPPFTLNQLLSL